MYHQYQQKEKSVEISSSDSLSSITIHKDGEELSHSMGNFSDDQVLDDVPLSPNKGTNGDENDLPFGPMQLARAHWIQLHKIDMQLAILKRMFLQLLQRHPPFRALWPFARNFDGTAVRLEQLLHSSAFRHFCQSYQASFTMLMDNLDDEPSLCRLLQEFGSNHFFYDCQESHLRMMRDEFFNALVDCLTGSNEELDVELAEDWEIIWAKFESNMGFGLKVQRHNYLAHCVTPAEMALLREQFSRLVGTKAEGPGIGPLAREIGTNGAIPFTNALQIVGMLEAANQNEMEVKFAKASQEILWAIEKAVSLWEPGTGFLRLCAEIDGKCATAGDLIQTASAPLLRRSFMEAFGTRLTEVFGDANVPELKQTASKHSGKRSSFTKKTVANLAKGAALNNTATMHHSWTKVYRVAEQAIIADRLDRG